MNSSVFFKSYIQVVFLPFLLVYYYKHRNLVKSIAGILVHLLLIGWVVSASYHWQHTALHSALLHEYCPKVFRFSFSTKTAFIHGYPPTFIARLSQTKTKISWKRSLTSPTPKKVKHKSVSGIPQASSRFFIFYGNPYGLLNVLWCHDFRWIKR